MTRAQLLFEPWQYDVLKSAAARAGKSISQIVRELVVEKLSPRRAKRASKGIDAIDGLFSDREASGREHDRFLLSKPKKRR